MPSSASPAARRPPTVAAIAAASAASVVPLLPPRFPGGACVPRVCVRVAPADAALAAAHGVADEYAIAVYDDAADGVAFAVAVGVDAVVAVGAAAAMIGVDDDVAVVSLLLPAMPLLLVPLVVSLLLLFSDRSTS